jgi:hypothetical protein
LQLTAPLPQVGVSEIKNNVTQGILVMNNGTAQMTGAVSVSNNGYNGVVAVTGGVAGFSPIGNPPGLPSVTQNFARDIFCDATSMVTGSNAVVGAAHRECSNQIPGQAPFIPRTPAP